LNLSKAAIALQAHKTPTALALEIIGTPLKDCEQTQWTYAQLDNTIRSIAGALIKKGMKPGDFLLLRLNSDAAFALTFFGAIAAGLVPIPLSAHLTTSELEFFAKDTKHAQCATWWACAPNLPCPDKSTPHIISQAEILSFMQAPPVPDYYESHADDPAYLVYTSGTTNHPKGVLHAQRVLQGRVPMQQGWHHIKQGDRVLHAGDFNWTYTLGVGLMDPWVQGATALIYQGEKSPALWPPLIESHQVTIFAAVPGVYRQVLKYGNPTKQNMASLRHGLSAGESLPKQVHTEWKNQTGCSLYEAMGQSEISTYVSTAPNIEVPEGAKGRIQKGRNVVILPFEAISSSTAPNTGLTIKETDLTPLAANQKGLIAIHNSDPGLMLCYWQREEQQKQQFCGPWFLTGDIGTIDDNQNLTHYGRYDDIMNAGGYRISPSEIEALILSHNQVEEAAVYEKPIRPGLSIIEAVIVLNNPKKNKNYSNIKDQIMQLLAKHLAPYKHPKAITIVPSLPRSKAGKVDKGKLSSL